MEKELFSESVRACVTFFGSEDSTRGPVRDLAVLCRSNSSLLLVYIMDLQSAWSEGELGL